MHVYVPQPSAAIPTGAKSKKYIILKLVLIILTRDNQRT